MPSATPSRTRAQAGDGRTVRGAVGGRGDGFQRQVVAAVAVPVRVEDADGVGSVGGQGRRLALTAAQLAAGAVRDRVTAGVGDEPAQVGERPPERGRHHADAHDLAGARREGDLVDVLGTFEDTANGFTAAHVSARCARGRPQEERHGEENGDAKRDHGDPSRAGKRAVRWLLFAVNQFPPCGDTDARLPQRLRGPTAAVRRRPRSWHMAWNVRTADGRPRAGGKRWPSRKGPRRTPAEARCRRVPVLASTTIVIHLKLDELLRAIAEARTGSSIRDNIDSARALATASATRVSDAVAQARLTATGRADTVRPCRVRPSSPCSESSGPSCASARSGGSAPIVIVWRSSAR